MGNYNLVTTFSWGKGEQLKGRKIAAAGPNVPWVQAIGAIPVQSNLNEAYTSLQTGVYQGWVLGGTATIEEIFQGSFPFLLMLSRWSSSMTFPIISTWLPSLM